MSDIPDNLTRIQSKIESACRRSNRSLSEVTLIAVSKTHSPEAIRDCYDSGQLHFGESKVQEAKAKIPLLPSALQWHLIGHLQTNKIKAALPLFGMIHSVDSLRLAREINSAAAAFGLFPQVLLEINSAGESTKYGFKPDELIAQLEELLALDRIQINGLMTIPPPVPSPEEARPYFASLRELREECESRAGAPLPSLSMGMSHDFEIAIEEGSTHVRVGTAIFGTRTGKSWRPSESENFG